MWYGKFNSVCNIFIRFIGRRGWVSGLQIIRLSNNDGGNAWNGVLLCGCECGDIPSDTLLLEESNEEQFVIAFK